MATAKFISKKIVLNKLEDIVYYQLMIYCFTNDINLSVNEMNCLVDLAITGESDLSTYCMEASEKSFFKSPQSVRNFLGKAESLNLIEKSNGTKKKVKIKDNIEIKTSGNIVYDLRSIYVFKEN